MLPTDATVLVLAERLGSEIKIRGSAPIESDLGLAETATPLFGREVKIWKLDRTLQLVGAVAGEENERYMGLDDIDPVHDCIVRRWIAQERDDGALAIGLLAHGIGPRPPFFNARQRRPLVRPQGA